jgi:ABC-2 type transport system ATP-binding protein
MAARGTRAANFGRRPRSNRRSDHTLGKESHIPNTMAPVSTPPLIEVEHLSRYYGDTCAVRDVSFRLERGEVLGFLGPNGAGKSSTMQIISGTLAPSAGRVLIDGIDILDEPKRAKAQIGYLPEQPPLYRELTVDEYLRYCARLHGMRRGALRAAVEAAKERCGLAAAGQRLIGNLSKGYQQRVGIAQAVVHLPAVIILDEPTVGLDPIQIREIRGLIRELGREHGVILSTHILPEVQATCSRVQIIHRGRLVFHDSTEHLGQRLRATSLLAALRSPPPLGELAALPGVAHAEPAPNGRVRLHYDPAQDPAEALVERAVSEAWGLYELIPEHKSLEQIFIELTCSDLPHHPTPAEAEAGAAA